MLIPIVSLPTSVFPPLAVGFMGLGTSYLTYGLQELFGYPRKSVIVDFATGMWGIWLPGFMQFFVGVFLFAGLELQREGPLDGCPRLDGVRHPLVRDRMEPHSPGRCPNQRRDDARLRGDLRPRHHHLLRRSWTSRSEASSSALRASMPLISSLV